MRTAYHLQIVTIRDSAGVNQMLQTTDEHRFHVKWKGWMFAEALVAGDILLEPGWEDSVVLSSVRKEHPEGVTVYNLEVEGAHTYFVRAKGSGAEPVWVHNATYSDPAVQKQSAVEIQLEASDFDLPSDDHMDIADDAFADMLVCDRSLEGKYRAKYGSDFVDSVLDGERPKGWTWHHALRSQANGEAGWLQLMPTDYHVANSGMFHPNGFGEYNEWAVPAGAPYPRTGPGDKLCET